MNNLSRSDCPFLQQPTKVFSATSMTTSYKSLIRSRRCAKWSQQSRHLPVERELPAQCRHACADRDHDHLHALSFIASIYGMNFEHMPELNPRGYPAVLAVMALVCVGMLFAFRNNGGFNGRLPLLLGLHMIDEIGRLAEASRWQVPILFIVQGPVSSPSSASVRRRSCRPRRRNPRAQAQLPARWSSPVRPHWSCTPNPFWKISVCSLRGLPSE